VSKYPEITPSERGALILMGWLFNPREGIWMLAPGDVPFSDKQEDHDFKFAEDVAKLRAEEAHALNYATTGTAPYITD
jgi:hypothetical protein